MTRAPDTSTHPEGARSLKDLRSQAAVVHTLFDHVERLAAASKDTEVARAHLVEELTRLGTMAMEAAASMARGSSAAHATRSAV